MNTEYDLCIIGGGINGTGIARDAAGRGLSVLLVEAEDLAGGTSSMSTKLIHGGLRYLEYGQIRLVREALKERETLLGLAPHLIRPMEFVLPHDPQTRPYWMIRAGLFLYDHLARRKKISRSRSLDLSLAEAGWPLEAHESEKKGFAYFDCWADDARLVVLNALDAAARGATILTRTACTRITPQEDRYEIDLRMPDGHTMPISANAVINAAGPWVQNVLENAGLPASDDPDRPKIRLVKGSHLIVKKIYDGPQAYILQQPDKRIVFAIPYEKDYTLIGTTEEDYSGDPREARISEEETAYLIKAANTAFTHKIDKQDALWSYSGVRPLFDDGDASATSASRDYRLYEHKHPRPMISVFGGKLTTYRVLAERAVTRILGMQGREIAPWTAGSPLPGGRIPDGDMDAFIWQKEKDYPFLPPDLLERYAYAYGTRMDLFLEGAARLSDLGTHFGDHVYEAEILYLLRCEWAQTAEDILWRRSKLGLHVTDQTAQRIEQAVPRLMEALAA